MRSSLEIAQDATLRPIADVAAEAGIEPDELEQYGRYKAKVDLSILERLADRPDGKIVNVTAITPTPAGEGKTTTSVSLTQGLGALGRTARARAPRGVARPGVRREGRCGGRRATRRSCRWRTSTSTSRATCTRSRPRTTSSPR